MGISICNVNRLTSHDPAAMGRSGERHHIKHLSVGRGLAPAVEN